MALPRLFEKSKTSILKILDRDAKPLKQAGLQVRAEVREGSPRRMISCFAKNWNADLIMVGAHEHSPLAHLCLGSVAPGIMRHAPCSVEIVRTRHKNEAMPRIRELKILVATDGSEFSVAALRSVAARPWPEGSQVKVISVPEFILAKDASYLQTHPIERFEDLRAVS